VYDWGSLSCSYVVQGNRLDFLAEVANTSSSETITTVSLRLAALTLPLTSANLDRAVDNTTILGECLLLGGNCSISLGNWEVKNPVSVWLGGPTAAGEYPVKLTVPGEKRPHHPIVDDANFVVPGRPVAPGQKDAYHVSLSFGAPGASLAELCPEVLSNVAGQRPLEIDWKDRRPIGAMFLADSFKKWPTNPRGYLFGKGAREDVTTPEGRTAFGAALLHRGDQVVASLKAMNAQGVVVWDLEGQELWQPVSYLGDPRLLSKLSPEMDQFADAFFKKFTEAGLRTGICIRPTEVYWSDTLQRWNQREVRDPVQTISDKIDYAQKRWGCTLFYFDSNVFGKQGFMTREQDAEMKEVPVVFPLNMLEALHKKHPDVMLFPEWRTATSYLVSMPYCSPNVRQYGTPPAIRAVYPEAASFVYIEDQTLTDNWETYLNNVVGGDIVSFFDYPGTASIDLVKSLYEEAGFRKQGMPASVKGASFGQRLALVHDPDARTRYFTASSLAKEESPKAYQALIDLLDDADVVVRKNALVALAQTPAPKDASVDNLSARLVTMIRNQPVLAPFAADALGELGAVAPAVDLFHGNNLSQQMDGMRALSKLSGPDPKAVEALTLLTKSAQDVVREHAAAVLGQIRATQAVPLLISMLNDEDEFVSVAAVKALGEMPRESVQVAIEPLVKLFERHYRTVVVYSYRVKIDEALRDITGEKLPQDAAWWEQWLASHPAGQP